MSNMRTSTDRFVVVDASVLADLLDLASRVVETAEQTAGHDGLNSALRGAIGEVRASAVIEPR